MDLLPEVRGCRLALPEVTERPSHGTPTWCAAPPGAQQELVETEPDRFFRPPYEASDS